MIQQSAKKIVDTSRKSNETRDEIDQLVNGLVELEYKETDSNLMIPMFNKHYGEDDYLGISKFATPNSLLPSKRSESQRYIDSLQVETTRDFFRSDEYLTEKQWQLPEAPPENSQSDSSCKCLQDYYNQHSKCS